jgi:hypothetical protein
MMFLLGRISMFALALVAVGDSPAQANLLGTVSGAKLEQSLSASPGFEEIALKCKQKNKCKKHKKPNQQNDSNTGQTTML